MKLWTKSQCARADGISRNFSLLYFLMVLPMKTRNVSFYSLPRVLSDSVINFIEVRYQNITLFVITEKYIDRKLSSYNQWS